MNIKGIIKKGYISKLIFYITCIFFLGIAISSLLFYYNVYQPFEGDYSNTLSIVVRLREVLLFKTISIFILFYLLIIAGIAILSLFYSHRVAGPLYMIKTMAKRLGNGEFDTNVKFRRKDPLTVLADSINEVSEGYRDRLTKLVSEIDNLKKSLADADSFIKNAPEDEIEKVLAQIALIDKRITKMLFEIKL